MFTLQDQYQQLQLEVDERSRAAAKASEDSCAADVAVLKQQLQRAQAALGATEADLARAQAAANSADTAQLDAYHALQMETLMLRTRLGELLPIEEKYKAVLVENRELYNTVQDLRGNIRVFCRCVGRGCIGCVQNAANGVCEQHNPNCLPAAICTFLPCMCKCVGVASFVLQDQASWCHGGPQPLVCGCRA